VNPGFSTDHVLTARLWMPVPNDPKTGIYLQHDKRVWFFRASLEKILATPGVESAAWSARLPLAGGRANAQFRIKDRPQADGVINTVEPQLATPTYFETLKIGLVDGRVFTDAETAAMPPTVVVSESFAKKYFPSESALDKQIFLGRQLPPNPKWATIVGVVRDVRSTTLDAAPMPQLYLNVWQTSNLSMALEVRAPGDPAQLVEPITRAIRSVDPELPLFNVQPMSAVLATSVAERRFSMIVIGVFGALALLLSAVGIYGVLAYLVQQRTSEIGVRMALGASRSDVLRLIVGHGLTLTTIGIGIGLVASAFAARSVATMLFSVAPFDVPTFAVVAAALTGVAALACLVPAWRATRIDPLTALRQE
jgi:putative ABC transport system permease protein